MSNKKDSQISNLNQIPVKGSLGILAYGDIAIRAWKKVKRSQKISFPIKK